MKLFSLIATAVLLLAPASLQPATEMDSFDSIIVTKITDISGDQYDDIEYAVNKIDELNIEYTCLWSGVMVFKLNKSPLSENGDIQMYIKAVLNQATALKKLEILHVYTGLSGVAKC
ncbi:MAG: hypothetical protein OER04_05590 [Cyclobacteriaceae bacterium]|nr:hypothetical protein [Cyclobacteriaceae bacterium]